MLQPLNIAVDSLVASAVPDLTTHADAEDLRLGVFSAFESPTAIAERLKAFKPDIILVDSVWLVLAALLESTATKTLPRRCTIRCNLSRIALAS
ncbi:MAG: hypothetical protein EB104_03855 [Acidimicrobiia bacterium]|nr:hypothetical protein [Acidimicrobiia bacterium]